MRLVVECTADEALAQAVGIAGRNIEHSPGRGRVCKRLQQLEGATGMVDDDPGVTKPAYFKCLVESKWDQGIRLLDDKERGNRIVILSPRLEEWLVQSAKQSGLKMTDYGFGSDNGVQLHAEINQRLESLAKLVSSLLASKSQRLLYFQSVLVGSQFNV
ncbi:MAG: hypothetical protein ABSG78_13060 [Verrucomicrobiota bacterium]|jgi:hypothetical protein